MKKKLIEGLKKFGIARSIIALFLVLLFVAAPFVKVEIGQIGRASCRERV